MQQRACVGACGRRRPAWPAGWARTAPAGCRRTHAARPGPCRCCRSRRSQGQPPAAASGLFQVPCGTGTVPASQMMGGAALASMWAGVHGRSVRAWQTRSLQQQALKLLAWAASTSACRLDCWMMPAVGLHTGAGPCRKHRGHGASDGVRARVPECMAAAAVHTCTSGFQPTYTARWQAWCAAKGSSGLSCAQTSAHACTARGASL